MMMEYEWWAGFAGWYLQGIAVIECMYFFFFQAEDGIRDYKVTGVQTCALPILQLALHHVWRPRPLRLRHALGYRLHGHLHHWRHDRRAAGLARSGLPASQQPVQIGRASCRERV